MAAFDHFDAEYYSVDSTVITKKIAGYATAYGRIPILIGNGQSGVHQFDLKVISLGGQNYCFIGIDQGRKNLSTYLRDASTNHYVLGSHDGYFYQKGTSQRLLI